MSWSWPEFPPTDSKSALGLPVLLAGVVALVPRARLPLLLGPAFLMAFYVMSSQRAVTPAVIGSVVITAGATLAYLLAKRRPGGAVPFAWMSGLGIAAILFPLLKYAAAGQMLGSMSAAFGAMFVVAAWRKTSVADGALPMAVALYGVLANAHLFLYPEPLPLSAAILLGIAPLAAWIGELRWFREKPWWMDWGARASAVAVIAIVGVALALQAMPEPEPESEEESNPYYD